MPRNWRDNLPPKYPTDLTDAQWRMLQPSLRKRSRPGRLLKYDRRTVINAILYVLRAGGPWRLLPKDFPRWKAIYQIFDRWRNDGTWRRIHDALRKKVRKAAGKRPTPSAALIDSQSVKTTEVGGPERGYDGAKKVSGRKRHLVVDTLGLILTVKVHAANRQDHDAACQMLLSLWERMKRIRVIFADAAYGRNGLPELAQAAFGFTLEIVKRSTDASGFHVLPKRWIAERTLGWLGRSRRLSKDYERNPETSETMIYISMIHLMLKRLERDEITNLKTGSKSQNAPPICADCLKARTTGRSGREGAPVAEHATAGFR